MKTLYKYTCKNCGDKFERGLKKAVHCSKSCNTSYNNKNRAWKQSSKDILREKRRGSYSGSGNPNWRGGGIKFCCKNCFRIFIVAKHDLDWKKHSGKYCSAQCYREYASRNKMSPHQDRINRNMRKAVTTCVKEKKLGRKWINLVGYSSKELLLHLEKQFKDGISWDNYGEWHIDHIVPVSAFNFTKYSDPDLKLCWALSNLQPLWAKDNNIKGGVNRKSYEEDVLKLRSGS